MYLYMPSCYLNYVYGLKSLTINPLVFVECIDVHILCLEACKEFSIDVMQTMHNDLACLLLLAY